MTKSKSANKALILFGAVVLFVSPVFAQTDSKPAGTGTSVPPATGTPAASPSASNSPAQTTITTASAPKVRVEVPPEKARPLRIPRLDKPPVIDGKLNEDVGNKP